MRLSILLTLTVTVLVAGVLVSAQAPDATAAPKGSAENGKKIYTSYGCYQCHNYAAHGGRAGCVPNLVEKGKWRNLLLTKQIAVSSGDGGTPCRRLAQAPPPFSSFVRTSKPNSAATFEKP